MTSDPPIDAQVLEAMLSELHGLPGALRTSYLGRPLHVLHHTASTNDVARTLGEEGAEEGATVIALEQGAGRGRRGRSWASPLGGLYLSVVLRPRMSVSLWPALSLAAAVGAASGVEAAGGPKIVLKWPNDLIVKDRLQKAGGILLESAPQFAVVGIGINASVPSGALPEGAASISVPIPRLGKAVLERLEEAIEMLYTDPAGLLDLWRRRSMTLGKPVRVVQAPEGEALEGVAFEGVAEDVDAHGALLVRTTSGVRRVLAGEVSLR